MTTPPSKTTVQRSRFFQAAGIVAIFLMITRFAGLIREVLLRYYYELETNEAVAYAFATTLPDLVFAVVVGGALGSAFIPTFAEFVEDGDEEGSWALFSAVLNLILIVITLIALILAVFSEPLLRTLFIPAENVEILALATRIMRVQLISIVIFGVSSLFMATLNAKQHFLAPALAGALYNLGIILGLWLFAPNIMGAAWGAVVGALAHLAVQFPPLLRLGVKYRPIITLSDYGVRQVLILMGPRVLGLSFSYFNRPAMGIIARPLARNTFPSLLTGFQIMMVPVSFLGQSLGIAAFPTLAGLAANQDYDGIRQILNRALRSIFFLGLPMTVGLILIRQPLVALLFERGIFSADRTLIVASALLFYGLAIIPVAGLEVIARTFYALKDTWTPVIAGLVQILGMLALGAYFAYSLFPTLGIIPVAGLAFAFALSNWIEVGVLLWLLRRRLGRLGLSHLLDGLWRMGLASLGMGLLVWLCLIVLRDFHPIWPVLVSTTVGGGAYFLASYLLQLEEVRQLVAVAMRRLGG